MYIEKIKVENIRSLEQLEIKFAPPYAGWHVIIGDNGSGKSSFVRAVAINLIGDRSILGLRQNWRSWVGKLGDGAGVVCDYVKVSEVKERLVFLNQKVRIVRMPGGTSGIIFGNDEDEKNINVRREMQFSSSFGPFRRFTGGSIEWESIFSSNPEIAPHISAFGEEVALSESLDWIVDLNYKKLENKPEGRIVQYLIDLLNHGGLLPHGTIFESVSSDGIFFRDGNGIVVKVEELSDGYRSILSLTFELIRQMVGKFGPEKVFASIKEDKYRIDLPGVVLIDEIDAHLHPTWQVRIGKWFRKYFPKLQFIVTTHSPLICHAAEEGSVWKLSAPGSNEQAREIKGKDLQRLLYGNILDAYGTEAFGKGIGRSESAKEKLSRLAKLNVKFIREGKLSEEESREREELIITFPSEAGTLQ